LTAAIFVIHIMNTFLSKANNLLGGNITAIQRIK